MKPTLTLLTALLLAPLAALHAAERTGVSFRTSDANLQRLFEAAETEPRRILSSSPTMKAMVNGGGYGNAWIEREPMGGEMYASGLSRLP